LTLRTTLLMGSKPGQTTVSWEYRRSRSKLRWAAGLEGATAAA